MEMGFSMGPRRSIDIKQEIKQEPQGEEPVLEISDNPEGEAKYTIELTESERKFIADVLGSKANQFLNESGLYFDHPRQMAIQRYNILAEKFETK